MNTVHAACNRSHTHTHTHSGVRCTCRVSFRVFGDVVQSSSADSARSLYRVCWSASVGHLTTRYGEVGEKSTGALLVSSQCLRPSVRPSVVSSSSPPRFSLGRHLPVSLGRRLRASTSIPAVSRCRVSPFYAQTSPSPSPTACLVHRLSTSFLSLDILNRRSVHASKQPCTSAAAHCLQLQAPHNTVAVCRRPSPRPNSSHPYTAALCSWYLAVDG